VAFQLQLGDRRQRIISCNNFISCIIAMFAVLRVTACVITSVPSASPPFPPRHHRLPLHAGPPFACRHPRRCPRAPHTGRFRSARVFFANNPERVGGLIHKRRCTVRWGSEAVDFKCVYVHRNSMCIGYAPFSIKRCIYIACDVLVTHLP
jgi:hypothetical protein